MKEIFPKPLGGDKSESFLKALGLCLLDPMRLRGNGRKPSLLSTCWYDKFELEGQACRDYKFNYKPCALNLNISNYILYQI